MDDDTLYALALARVPGVGPRTWSRLMAAFGGPAAVFRAGRSALRSLGLSAATESGILAPDWNAARTDADWLDGPGPRHLLRLAQPGYPRRLAEIPDPPPLLFVTGDPTTLHRPQVAIVGSRHATASGRDLARNLAGGLARAGIATTSGLATGIDAAAHRGALEAGGTTLAVVGTEPDQVYPARHQRLHAEITASGAVLGELPPGSGPLAAHFPRRNRIVSGLSLGVVVIQAGRHSGSLITARLAAEQGREVFAVPGSIHDPLARGCHALLRDGAKLLESIDDILKEFPGTVCEAPVNAPSESTSPAADPDEARILEALGHDPLTLDTLQQRSGLTLDRLSSILLTMELKGLLTAVPGGRYQRRGPEG
ncbi:DNA-protecting protein DprA [Halorhodospira halophila]|nr:DNA-processing protein DprA [Halorhodospira halophila]MBK1727791.1 DNA-protecting protein DprA [Halorhodospira halophila]